MSPIAIRDWYVLERCPYYGTVMIGGLGSLGIGRRWTLEDEMSKAMEPTQRHWHYKSVDHFGRGCDLKLTADR